MKRKQPEPRFKSGDSVWVIVNGHEVRPATIRGVLDKGFDRYSYSMEFQYALTYNGDVRMSAVYESLIYPDPTRPNTTKTENYHT